MSSYKGNRGHLMQHWPLCEMLEVAAHKGVTGLNLIDAYAMAPLATENAGKDAKFQRAENRLPNLPDSAPAYDRAWRDLTSWHHPTPKGYPSSAAFVEQVWKRDFSMLLCEIDQPTIDEIKPWLQRVDKLERCKTTELFCSDWQERFKKKLPSPAEVELADGALTLVLFDPYICSQRQRRRVVMPNVGHLYIDDIEMAMGAMAHLDDSILMQLSTYSAMNNPQGAVISSVNQILAANDFRLLAVVHIGRDMMSLVYARNVSWAAELADLPGRFNE